MKSMHGIAVAGWAVGMALVAQPLSAIALPLNVHYTIQSERAAHPRMVAALNAMKAALADLQAAPHDFGGNKAAAMNDTRTAIRSIKRALYYRLRMDDAALDRLP